MGGGWRATKEEVEIEEARDHEYSDPHMAVNQLKTIMHNAEELMDMLGDKTELPEWVESKITLAEDYIMTVANYMRSEMHEEYELEEHVVKTDSGYKLVSKKTGKNLGTAKTKAGIEKRERQVQYFKHMGEEAEQLDELSPKTIASYSDKAYKEYSSRIKPASAKEPGNKEKIAKRWKGLTAAAGRGPKTHQVPAGKEPVSKSGRAYWGEETEQIDEATPAWQRKEGKSASGGLNRKGIASYRRANPGSKLSMAVTTKPSKLKKGSKAANRRKSFCARMGGMKKRLTSAKTARDPDSRINKALRKWNC